MTRLLSVCLSLTLVLPAPAQATKVHVQTAPPVVRLNNFVMSLQASAPALPTAGMTAPSALPAVSPLTLAVLQRLPQAAVAVANNPAAAIANTPAAGPSLRTAPAAAVPGSVQGRSAAGAPNSAPGAAPTRTGSIAPGKLSDSRQAPSSKEEADADAFAAADALTGLNLKDIDDAVQDVMAGLKPGEVTDMPEEGYHAELEKVLSLLTERAAAKRGALNEPGAGQGRSSVESSGAETTAGNVAAEAAFTPQRRTLLARAVVPAQNARLDAVEQGRASGRLSAEPKAPKIEPATAAAETKAAEDDDWVPESLRGLLRAPAPTPAGLALDALGAALPQAGFLIEAFAEPIAEAPPVRRPVVPHSDGNVFGLAVGESMSVELRTPAGPTVLTIARGEDGMTLSRDGAQAQPISGRLAVTMVPDAGMVAGAVAGELRLVDPGADAHDGKGLAEGHSNILIDGGRVTVEAYQLSDEHSVSVEVPARLNRRPRRNPAERVLPEAKGSSNGRFLVYTGYGYSLEDRAYTGTMGEAVDDVEAQFQSYLDAGQDIDIAGLRAIMDMAAERRGLAAIKTKQKDARLFGERIPEGEQEIAAYNETALPQLDADDRFTDIIPKDPSHGAGRHAGQYEAAAKAFARNESEAFRATIGIRKFELSHVVRLKDGTYLLRHPTYAEMPAIRRHAFRMLADAVNDRSISEAAFLDIAAQAYHLLMHAQPYNRGTPSIVETFFDGLLRAKFGATFPEKTAEPFWHAAFWDPSVQGPYNAAAWLSNFGRAPAAAGAQAGPRIAQAGDFGPLTPESAAAFLKSVAPTLQSMVAAKYKLDSHSKSKDWTVCGPVSRAMRAPLRKALQRVFPGTKVDIGLQVVNLRGPGITFAREEDSDLHVLLRVGESEGMRRIRDLAVIDFTLTQQPEAMKLMGFKPGETVVLPWQEDLFTSRKYPAKQADIPTLQENLPRIENGYFPLADEIGREADEYLNGRR